MRRLVALLVLVTACGGAVVGGTTSTADTPTTLGSDGDTIPGATLPQSTTTTSDRPVAPDFTLELGGGGSYTLSEGTKPVYMVFWAEW